MLPNAKECGILKKREERTKDMGVQKLIYSIQTRMYFGRYYIKDFEALGAIFTENPTAIKRSAFSYLQAGKLQFNGKTYHIVIKKTPLVNRKIYAVNEFKYHTNEEQKLVCKEIIREFGLTLKRNPDVCKEIRLRGISIMMGQFGMVLANLMAIVYLRNTFFANNNDILSVVISAIIFGISAAICFNNNRDSFGEEKLYERKGDYEQT